MEKQKASDFRSSQAQVTPTRQKYNVVHCNLRFICIRIVSCSNGLTSQHPVPGGTDPKSNPVSFSQLRNAPVVQIVKIKVCKENKSLISLLIKIKRNARRLPVVRLTRSNLSREIRDDWGQVRTKGLCGIYGCFLQ